MQKSKDMKKMYSAFNGKIMRNAHGKNNFFLRRPQIR